MKIRWEDEARADLKMIISFIKKDNPTAARRVHEEVKKAVQTLARYHQFGRIGRVINTRELVIPSLPYIIVYYIKDQEIRILSVMRPCLLTPTPLE